MRHTDKPRRAQSPVDAESSESIVGCSIPTRASKVGIAILKRAGIRSRSQSPGRRAKRLNEGFIIRITLGRPRGNPELAMSLDGRICTGKTIRD